MKKLTAFITAALVFVCLARSQNNKPPFWDDIQHFKQQDSIHPPPKHAILFVGSSSFTKWTDVQSYFPGYTIINRGFGGSSLPDVIRYADDVIFRYDPKEIVMYCGENDLAGSDTVSGKTVADRLVTIFTMIRSHYPGIPFLFVSLKPSPSRWHLHEKQMDANNRIRAFLAKQPHTAFIDVFHNMLGPDGKPMPDIYIGDQLHMNAKGYAIWQKLIAPHLLK